MKENVGVNWEGSMKKNFRIAPMAALAAVLLAAPLWASQTPTTGQGGLEEKVRHELVMLPFYSVYDNLNYEVNGDTVTLTGQVVRPVMKSDAEAVARRIQGVSNVVNQIEVLPVSFFDNQVRRAVYRVLFSSNSPLFRYGLGVNPSIHIIVKNGNVTLAGAVSREADKNIASLYVKQLFGVFSVTNNLTVS